ncbi:MAG: hypothetical protein MI743_09830 [Sneathiellales bacterium]|nr:hypothetical protein [Sneathiellales bacterium]
MSATSDSIQTLLKQRRELRHCLKELQDEISDLNDKASSMAEQNIGKKQQALITDTSSISSGITPPAAPEKKSKQPEPAKAIEKPNTAEKKKDIGDNQKEEGVKKEAIGEKAEALPEQDLNKEKESEEKDRDLDKEGEEIEGLSASELLLRARLLVDYLQNHPSNIPGTNLERLEKLLAEIDRKNSDKISDAENTSLKSAYRAVATQSFQELQVNGETIADSNGSVPLLWGLPLTVAALTLVFFPLALLIQSLADRMFVNDFAVEISDTISCAVAFAWGGSGALSTVCWIIAEKVHKKQYLEGSVRDSALRFTLGGVLGILVFLVMANWLPASGILNEMIIGVAAFTAGLPSGILFAAIMRLFRRGEKSVLKSG